MKFEVIGWTHYEDDTYPIHRGDYGAVDLAVEEAVRAGGYRFGGDTHQGGETCTPVLNDGTRVLYSFREWGYVMAEALSLYTDNGLNYMEWYMDIEKTLIEGVELVLPPAGVDRSRIKKRAELAETFSLHVSPAVFAAVAAGKKTVEICTKEEELERLCKGDFLLYVCGEKQCRVKVKMAESFASFDALFMMSEEISESERRHRRALVQSALYEGCSPEALYEALKARYPKGNSELYSVQAITFGRIPEKGEKA